MGPAKSTETIIGLGSLNLCFDSLGLNVCKLQLYELPLTSISVWFLYSKLKAGPLMEREELELATLL